MLCGMRFNSHIVKGQLKDKDIDKLIEIVKDWRVSVSKKEGGEDE